MTTTDAATARPDQTPSSPARLRPSAPTATATAHASRRAPAIGPRAASVSSGRPCSRSGDHGEGDHREQRRRRGRPSASGGTPSTAPARNGPMSEGTTHAAEKAAKTRPWIAAGTPGDDDVQRDGLTAGAEALDQAARRRASPSSAPTLPRRDRRRTGRPRRSAVRDAAAVAPRAHRDHADDARGERAGERDGVEASPSRSALTTGMTVVTASDWIAARKISATEPIVTQTYAELQMPPPRPTGAGANGETVDGAGHDATSAPMRSTASRSTSGEQPKLMRTWPLPSSPK